VIHWTAVTQSGTEAADVTWITYGSFHCDECLSASLQLQCMRQNCVRLSSGHALTFRPWTSVEEMEVLLEETGKLDYQITRVWTFFTKQVFDEGHPLDFR
jgi:hypothetical protein